MCEYMKKGFNSNKYYLSYTKSRSRPVSRVLSRTVIHLGYASPHTSSNLPEPDAGRTNGFLFGLAPSGVYLRHRLLPAARCALTAPFQPYRHPEGYLGGFLSVALSVGSRLPGVTWRSTLWSPDFPPRCTNSYSREASVNTGATAEPTPRRHSNCG